MKQNIMYKKIREIQSNPKLFLFEPTPLFLKTFLDGYAMREYEINGDSCYLFLQGLQEYIARRYTVDLSISWAHIINSQCVSNEDALSLFFQLVEEFNDIFMKNF